MLKTFHEGQLVTVAADGEELDGVVVHVPSLVKVEVAVEESDGAHAFRMVHPKSVTPREEEHEADEALRRLIRRNGPSGRAGLRGGAGGVRRAHSRASGHRTADK
jgi:hypothetical protein